MAAGAIVLAGRGARSRMRRVKKIIRKFTRGKKPWGKRNRGQNKSGALNRYIGDDPYPPKKFVKFVYTEVLNLSTVALSGNVGTTYYLGLNSLYDVYLAAGGHQPYGFDQLCTASGPYNRYKVSAVKISLEFFDPNADSGQHVCVAIHNPVDYAAGSTISGLSLDKVDEKHNTWTSFISATGSQKATLNRYFRMSDLFNLTNLQFKADIGSTTGSATGNPGATPAIEIGVLDPRVSASAISIFFRVRLTYFTMLYDRIQLAQS